MDGGHPRSGDVAGFCALQLGEGILQRLMSGIGVSRIAVTGPRELEQLGELDGAPDLERAAQVDRHIHRRLGGGRDPAGGSDGASGEAGHDLSESSRGADALRPGWSWRRQCRRRCLGQQSLSDGPDRVQVRDQDVSGRRVGVD